MWSPVHSAILRLIVLSGIVMALPLAESGLFAEEEPVSGAVVEKERARA